MRGPRSAGLRRRTKRLLRLLIIASHDRPASVPEEKERRKRRTVVRGHLELRSLLTVAQVVNWQFNVSCYVGRAPVGSPEVTTCARVNKHGHDDSAQCNDVTPSAERPRQQARASRRTLSTVRTCAAIPPSPAKRGGAKQVVPDTALAGRVSSTRHACDRCAASRRWSIGRSCC